MTFPPLAPLAPASHRPSADSHQLTQPLQTRRSRSTRTISLRLPESLLENLKMIANKRDVPYQSLLKIFLAERIDQEIRHRL